MQTFVMRLLGRRAIDNYGGLVQEAATLREVNKVLMGALAFYADEESYAGDPVPVLEDGGIAARATLKAISELIGKPGD